jgi:HAD superfamily hydrolase (TIGR01450 family)
VVGGYDAVLLDLDGTVYRGAEVIPGAPEAIERVRRAGKGVRFVTNNASRSPEEVAGQLIDLGIPVAASEVRTSAQAAAAVLAQRLAPGAVVLVVGAEALAAEVRGVGLEPVGEAAPEVDAVVQGLSKSIGWRELSEAVLAVRAGAFWVACNADLTLPTERGQVIGNGALVAAVAVATGARPVVAGKPNRPLMEQARGDAERPLVVGDRLDTDIAGAAAAEMDALLVLSGVSQAVDLLATDLRPRYIALDVIALTEPAADLEVADAPEWEIAGAGTVTKVRWRGGAVKPDPLRLLRGLCAHRAGVHLEAGDDTARAALAELGLLDRLA